MFWRGLSIIAISLGVSTLLADDLPPAKTTNGEVISAKGQPADSKVEGIINHPARYYIWVDPQGWHFRCAAKEGAFTTFAGTIELSDGEFGKLRPIGLETNNTKKKKKTEDTWRVENVRKKIQFTIHTAGSFDGFDFTLAKVKEARVNFDLKISGKAQPERIIIGKDSQHPKEAEFSLPIELQ
jgi:hypothetical protein